MKFLYKIKNIIKLKNKNEWVISEKNKKGITNDNLIFKVITNPINNGKYIKLLFKEVNIKDMIISIIYVL